MQVLESTQNALVKRLAALHKKSERQTQQQFLVEGKRAISGFMDHGWRAEYLLLRDPESLPEHWHANECIHMSAAISKKLSQHKQDSGYIAVFKQKAATVLDSAAGGLILYQLSDPGNCGTILRSAAAFAWQQVVIINGVDAYAPKVVQASVGAMAGLHIFQESSDFDLQPLAQAAPMAALIVDGGSDPRHMQRCRRWLVAGSEAHGLPPALIAMCQERICIPMASQVESLNAAVATSLAACLLSPHLT